MPARRFRSLLAVLLFAAYTDSYLWLSRRGYEEADRYGIRGFYYFTPEPTDDWRQKNYGCASLYAPLNCLDRALGAGRAPASEPLWGLSR